MNYRKYEFDHVVLFLLISLQNKLTFSNLTNLDLREHLKSTQNIFFEFHFWWKIAKFLIWFFEQKFKNSYFKFYLGTDRNVRFIIPIRHNFLLLCSIKSNWRERSLKDFRQMLSKMIPRDKCLQILLSFVTSRRVSFVFMTKSSKFKKSSSSQLQYRD